ncbi:MAG: TolC family protein [Paludibacter sp.]|nr:TolC family protein [Paludibacter sp.]
MMEKNWIQRTIILISILMINVVGYSQATDSLNYYLEIAEKNNPTVMQRYNEYQAALQKIPQASSLPDPQLEMGFFLSPMELMAGNQVADVKLMQMFPWFGVLKNAKDEMSLMAKAKYEAFVDAKLQVYFDVQSIWFDLYKVRQNLIISANNLELLKTIERLSIAKLKTGSTSNASNSASGKMQGNGASGLSASSGGMSDGMNNNARSSGLVTSAKANGVSAPMNAAMSSGNSSLVDIYRIQTEIQELENSILLLKNEKQIIQSKFNSQLNRNLQLPVAVINSLPVEPLDIAYLTVSDSMFVNNPMLTMLKYDQLSIDARKRMQQKMGLPMVGVGLNYSVISKSEMSTSPMNGQDMIMPMLSVTLPIYRKKYKAMQTESGYLKAASKNNYVATANALKIAYLEALQQYHDAKRRIKLYQNQRELTQKSVDILLKSFAASTVGLTEIVQVQQQMLDYEMKEVEAVVDYNKAISQLKRLKQ